MSAEDRTSIEAFRCDVLEASLTGLVIVSVSRSVLGQRIEQALQPSGGCHGCDAKGSCASSAARPGEERPLRFTRRG